MAKAVMIFLVASAAWLIHGTQAATDGSSTGGRFRLLKFLAVAAQLGLLVLVIRHYSLENRAFYDPLIALVFAGFLIHSLLPFAYRLLFFLRLSLAGIIGVFDLEDGGWLIGVGLLLIGICHLPVLLRFRVGLLLIAGAGLIVLRSGKVQSPWSVAIWPILASMFMFRLMVYLHDLKHHRESVSALGTLSYDRRV